MKILLTILLISVSLTLNAASFSQSKKLLLKRIYFDNQVTFYCSNPYEIKEVNGKEKALIVQNKQYYSPRNEFYKSGKVNTRAKRIEWEHVMPAHNFGRQLKCWQEGGRKACKKDKTFNTMEADMNNLVPAIGEVNGDRSNYRYGALKPNIGQYGNCKFEVDFKNKKAYPKDDIRGDIARIYFYMSDTYNLKLSKSERKTMEIWDKQDPISDWERKKNKRIQTIQGYSNPYIN